MIFECTVNPHLQQLIPYDKPCLGCQAVLADPRHEHPTIGPTPNLETNRLGCPLNVYLSRFSRYWSEKNNSQIKCHSKNTLSVCVLH